MSEKLVIKIDGPGVHPDRMTVQDVFTHVLELFQLVNESDSEARGEIQWRLVSASMNSPFTVIAEAVAVRPDVQVDAVARRQKSAFRRNYDEVRRGRVPHDWAHAKTRETVTRVLNRNRNGIGLTVIADSLSMAGTKDQPQTEIVITPEVANQAAVAGVAESQTPIRAKTQIGSLEGVLLQVASFYGNPAIQIRERKTGAEVWCVVPEAFQHEIAESTSLEDVWRGNRVVVRGKIMFGTDRAISRVEATSVRRVEPKHVSEDQIADKEFTGGLSVTEYLERLRDGYLG